MLKKLLKILIYTSFVLVANSCASDPKVQQADKIYNQQLQLSLLYVEINDLYSAKMTLKLLENQKKTARWYSAMGLLSQKKGDEKLSNEYFEKALEMDDKDPLIQNNYAVFLLRYHKPNMALEVLEKLKKMKEELTPGLLSFNKSLAYMQLKNTNKAKISLRKSARQNPNFAPAFLSMANILYNENNPECLKWFNDYFTLLINTGTKIPEIPLMHAKNMARRTKSVGNLTYYNSIDK